MRLDEHTAKELLAERGFRIPRGYLATTTAEAVDARRRIGGAVVLKPLLLTGKRGKAGLIRFAESDDDARREAEELFAHLDVEKLRIEELVDIDREIYIAVVNDGSQCSPVVLYSDEGGVDIESVEAVTKYAIDIRTGLGIDHAQHITGSEIAPLLVALYDFYQAWDAELVEINPLAKTTDGELIALDAKLVVDDAALDRHPGLSPAEKKGTDLEQQAKAAGLYYIEFDGDVGILANGAGLTMATLDAVHFYGGRPANFMEIGGDAYRKAEQALRIVLGNPRVTSLLVNLCGAYARTDVMIEGFLAAWKSLSPRLPLAFSIRGTGQERAQRLVRDELGLEPFETMDEAIQSAIELAGTK
jgi:succinyl-CoA synthetase beta subunit